MSEAAKEKQLRKWMKKDLSIQCLLREVRDKRREMSDEEELELLEKQRDIIDSILNQLQEEKRKLKQEIANWKYDKMRVEG